MADENRTTLVNLAIALVRNDPKTADFRLSQRWIARVQDDEDLRNACIQQGAYRAVAAARNFIACEQWAVQRHIQRERIYAVLAKAASEAREQTRTILGDRRFKRIIDDVKGRFR
jgi:hypothetical protein